MKSFASRMARLGTETAFEVLAQARALEAQGRDVVHLEIGEPDFDTPAHVTTAATEALRTGHTHYVPASGIRDLRAAIAEEVARTRGIPVAPEQVVVTPGGKPILFFSILALVNEGDEVIYPNPGFPIYESVIRFVGAQAVPLPLREERQFGVDVDELARLITPRTRMVILNSPANPTGGVLGEKQLRAIADLALRHDLWVLSDEIYSRILYDGSCPSITRFPGLPERTILLDGFSKTFAMTGWRLGYGVMNREVAQALERLMINSNSCTAAFTQVAGVQALRGDQEPVRRMVEEFRRRRDFVVDGLNRIPGVRCLKPQGAFYVFPNITGTGYASPELSKLLLHEAGVATLSGTAFGSFGEGFLRLSYAASMESLKKGLERIQGCLARATAGSRG